MFSRKSLLHRLRSKAALVLLSVAALAAVATTASSSQQAPDGHSCEGQYDTASLIISTEIASNGDQQKLRPSWTTRGARSGKTGSPPSPTAASTRSASCSRAIRPRAWAPKARPWLPRRSTSSAAASTAKCRSVPRRWRSACSASTKPRPTARVRRQAKACTCSSTASTWPAPMPTVRRRSRCRRGWSRCRR